MTDTTATLSNQELPHDMKTFFIIWGGQLISMLGSGLTQFALGVWIFDQTKQATPFAITVLLGSLPRIFLLPVAGSIADRFNRRIIMILADTFSALLTFAIFLLLGAGQLQLWHIYILSALGSVLSSFQEPAYTASIAMIVPKEKLGSANGMAQMGQALTSVLTPILAGALFVFIGFSGIIMIDFVTFFFAVGALIFVRIPQPERTPEHKDSNIWQDMAFGWNYLRERKGLFGLLLYYAMVNFLLNWSAVLLIPMVLSRFTADVLGVIQTVMGVGMLAGSIIMSAWGGAKRRIPAAIGFIVLGVTGFAVAGLQPNPFVIGAGIFILMFFVPLASGNSQVVFQTKVARDVQGRVFSVRSAISQSMMPIAFLTAGPLADKFFEPLLMDGGALANTFVGQLLGTGVGRGIGLMFILSGLTGIIVSTVVYLNPRIRNLEDELPDAIPTEEKAPQT
ncbi:MAG TPA: MFS transporter [Anaerolineales bacterium]|nr:MFS transporter [Anaerolineales bacterium]HNA89736.1 MFS transporter [Anaerolineales bacterium]HNB37249.1 MFS transporter [Anaerolineales bacterium]HNC08921.1 MFS transporter [Anaerolineales bacterium]